MNGLIQDNIIEYKDKGLTGLANVGNSCYLNACMQILSHTYEFNHFLSKGSYKNKLNRCPESVLLLEWDKLRELMWSENCTIAPWGFVKSMKKIAALKDRDLFTTFGQNDVPEFLYFLIDSFHTALAREVDMSITGNVQNSTDKLAQECYEMMKTMFNKEYSEILTIFYGITVTRLTSIDKNEDLSFRPEPFSTLSLPIPDQEGLVTIFDCLDYYCSKERMEGDSAWYNEDMNRKEAVDKSILFWSLPNILIIDFKRFTNNNRKLHKLVSSPLKNADFSKYIHGYNKSSYIYDLYGVCNHNGGCLGGHYISYVKNANNKWYSFNDTTINEIAEHDVITDKVYCLFYRKKK